LIVVSNFDYENWHTIWRRQNRLCKEGKLAMISTSIKRRLRSKEAVLLLVTIIVILAFYINSRTFLSVGSLRGVMQNMSVVGIMAIGVSFLFIGGGIDLSMTFVALFGGVFCALMIQAGVPWGLAMIIALAVGACIGAISAFLVTKVGIMAFVATIAVSSILQGVNLILTNAQNVSIPVGMFAWGSRTFGIFPFPFIIMVALLLVYGIILNKTQFGRNMFLVGGNDYAARLAGINPKKVRAVLYINSAVLATLGGLVSTSRLRSASPLAAAEWQLDAITASILGGVAFGGGSGSMAGCFIGILMLNFFNFGLSSLGIDAYWETIASGMLLLIALALDFLSERSRQKALLAKSAADREQKVKGANV